MMEKLSSELEIKCRDFDDNYRRIKERMAKAAEQSGRKAGDIKLLAAVKTVPPELINHAVSQGIDLIGDNRVQEMLSKYDSITGPVVRHFIGHLQTNKVAQVVPKVDMIESVDSVRLAEQIGKQSLKTGRVTDILLEVNIGMEESKSGFLASQVAESTEEISHIEGVFVKGLMTVPPICEKNIEICSYFEQMQKLFIDISDKNIDNVSMEFLSMGMSGDFEQAIRFGANIVRLGSCLFGARNYI